MSDQEELFNRVKTALYPLKVEINSTNDFGILDSITVTASTGIHTTSMVVTMAFLENMNFHIAMQDIRKQLNYDIYRHIMKENYKNVQHGLIVDTAMPVDKIYTIVHPEKHRELLQQFGSRLYEMTECRELINWRERLDNDNSDRF